VADQNKLELDSSFDNAVVPRKAPVQATGDEDDDDDYHIYGGDFQSFSFFLLFFLPISVYQLISSILQN
jgi:hypothetical protein